MKKIFGLALALSLSLALVACGGGGTASTTSDAAVAAGVIAPAVVGSLAGGASLDVNETFSETITWSLSCGTSGAATTTGTWTADTVTGTVAISTATTFNSCAGTDTRCNINYVLGGTVNSTADMTGLTSFDDKVNITQSGTVNVTGFATFDCAVDTVTSISLNEMALIDDSNLDAILAYMSGTICGKTIAEIKTLIDGDDATYCAGITDAAAANS
jgi:hypothetical protein